MKDEGIYKEFCELNNISFQDSELYKIQFKNTFSYQSFKLKYEIDLIFKQFYKELDSCAKYAKRKGIIK